MRYGEVAELVEGARLEIVLGVKTYEGSNPSLSAMHDNPSTRMGIFYSHIPVNTLIKCSPKNECVVIAYRQSHAVDLL